MATKRTAAIQPLPNAMIISDAKRPTVTQPWRLYFQSITDVVSALSFDANGNPINAATLPIAQSDVVNLVSDLALKAPLDSPHFTGIPTAPTAAPSTGTTQLATTAYVDAAVSGGGSGNVSGPASATDNAVALFNGTTGKLIKNSIATLDGTNTLRVGPSASFAVSANTTAISGMSGPGVITAYGANGVQAVFSLQAVGAAPVTRMVRANGVMGALTPVITDDTICNIFGSGLAANGTFQQRQLISGFAETAYLDSVTSPMRVEVGQQGNALGVTSTGLVQFSGRTASFPALKRIGASLAVRLADDSADGVITTVTAPPGTSSTQVATTAFVTTAVATGPSVPALHHTTHEPGNTDTLTLTGPNLLFGKGVTGPGAMEEITVGANLVMTGTTLSAITRSSSIYEYNFSAANTEPPGANQIRFDAGFPYTAVTKVWVWDITADGEDVFLGLKLIPVGARIAIQDKNNHNQFALFRVTADPIDKTTYFELPVTHLDHGTSLSGGQPVLFQVFGTTPSGDVVGPASATNNAIALFNGTTGKLIKDSATLLTSLATIPVPFSNLVGTDIVIAESQVTNLVTDLAAKVAGPASSLNNAIAIYSGTSGKIIKDSAIQFANVAIKNLANTFTAANDFTGGSITAPTAAPGTNSTVVATTAFVTAAISASPSGDVVGPASATDNALAVYNGATGKLIKNSTLFAVSDRLAFGGTASTDTAVHTNAGRLEVITGDGTGQAILLALSMFSSASGSIGWDASTRLSAPVDGNLLLRDNAGTAFGRMQFGGTTASFPAWKRNGPQFAARLADDSADAVVTAATATAGDSTTKVATTAFVATSFAPLASPALTGVPTAPTAAVGTNTTQIATTAYVMAAAALPGLHHTTHETGGSDALTALSAAILTSGTLPNARLDANVTVTNSVAIAIGATTTAATGSLRFSNAGDIRARNGSNTGDIFIIGTDVSNNIQLGNAGTNVIPAGTANTVDFGGVGREWRTGYFGTSLIAPTAAPGTNSTVVATTAFVTAAIAASPAGDVVGPAGATDNALAVYNGTTGKAIKNSAVLLTDVARYNVSGSWANPQTFSFSNAYMYFIDSGSAVDNRKCLLQANANTFQISTLSDAGVVQTQIFLDRFGLLGIQTGIYFPAASINPSSGSTVLDDYREGAWVVTDQSGAVLGFTTDRCTYTKVGRKVFVSGQVVWPTTGSGLQVALSLPFTVGANSYGGGTVVYNDAGLAMNCHIAGFFGTMQLYTAAGAAVTNTMLSGKTVRLVAQYIV